VYHRYLQDAAQFLDTVIADVIWLATAADRIGADYDRAEQLAKVRTEDVRAVLPPPTASAGVPAAPGPE
jgi:hypothetical protein